MRDIHIRQAIKEKNVRWIDVRSPGEYETATVPGAVNIPLFDNEERAQIGTVYKKEGRETAVRLGMEIVSPKIPRLVDTVLSHSMGRTPLLFCWRGGMRSRALATFLDLAQHPVLRLEGGYRSYREYVVERLSDEPLTSRMIVLHGLTGVGKTALLHRLKALGAPVLDLESLAGHRGSAFGSLGELRPRNQRMFDSYLLEQLERYKDEPYLFMEAESKRIGRVHLPDFLERAKKEGIPVLVEASATVRVNHILDTYLGESGNPERFRQQLAGSIRRIERRLSPDTRKNLWQWIAKEEYRPLVQALLREYYDPRYRHSLEQYEGRFALRIRSDDPDSAARKLREFHRHLIGEKPAKILL
ncbi:tRNA 2-selenouridine synthase [Melghirimyces profundicolus]|uniref:tRNA 2-selenouridine synthase n=1 Tax=Melghirimyces profundicolus TaxID=1242148 RepID=A0A2T6BQE7_9BACL|nr:tRNA 2-selenouridine(34) synthase MnmH [Melghirimyces profundicolus]PTX58262.1 tRNA 2-selenouridine synthase [Melghirimyces profundicolus]